MIEFQYAILALIWFDDKREVVKIEELPISLFEGLEREYRTVMEYRRKGLPWDVFVGRDNLGSQLTSKLTEYLGKCAGLTLYDHYVRTLKKHTLQRKLEEKIEEGKVSKEDMKQLIQDLALTEEDESNVHDFNGSLLEYIDFAEKRMVGDYERYQWGIPLVDSKLGSMIPKEMVTIGAFSGTGKTNISLQSYLHFIKNKVNCIYYTSEMGQNELMDRLIAMDTGLSASEIRENKLSEKGKKIYTDGTIQMNGLPGHIIETARFDIARIKRDIDKYKAKICYIDYIQMFRLQGQETRAAAMSEIATSLKEIAMEKSVIIFVLSQLNKEEGAKESGGIEEKSDVVIKLLMSEDDRKKENFSCKDFSFSISKNRYGSNGSIRMRMNKNSLTSYPIDFNGDSIEWMNK